MNESERLEAAFNAIKNAIPRALSSVGLDNFQDYLDDTPNDAERMQLAIWHAKGENSISREAVSFLIRAQMPDVNDPKLYLSAIWLALKKALDPSIVYMIDREMTYIVWYPGEKPGAGESSIIDFEVEFSRRLDDEEE